MLTIGKNFTVRRRAFFSLLVVVVVLIGSASLAYAAQLSWMGNHTTTQQPGSRNFVFYVESYEDYFGTHAEVGVESGGTWTTHEMTYIGKTGNNSQWSVTVHLSDGNHQYYFHGWDNFSGPQVWDNNGGSNYTIYVYLAATLNSLTATATPGRVAVDWETAIETDTLGFNLYRADAGGEWTRLNAAMIPSAAPGSPFGASYRYSDATAARGASYLYRVAGVGLDGGETSLDSVSVTMPWAWRWLPMVAR